MKKRTLVSIVVTVVGLLVGGLAMSTGRVAVAAGPAQPIQVGDTSLSNISLNGVPGTQLVVAPGANVTISANWSDSHPNYCPGCIDFVAAAFQGFGAQPAGCIENPGFTGQSGSGTVNLGSAPVTPGTYNIIAEFNFVYYCSQNWNPSGGTVIAQIVIPAPPCPSGDQVAGDLVCNGSFEDAGGQTFQYGSFGFFPTIPGWTAVPVACNPGEIELDRTGAVGVAPANGNLSAELNSECGPNGLYQDLATTAGTSYFLKFSFAARPGTNPSDNILKVYWGGTLVATEGPTTTAAYTRYSIPVTASGTTTRLEFDSGSPCCTTVGTELDAVAVVGPITATGTTINATEGSSFSGTVATFTDPDPFATAAEYSASINWGDSSSSAGTVTANTSGGFIVSGTHTYAEEGSDSVTVTIKDDGGSSATATSTATVADAALTATGTAISATEGASFSGTVAFTDADPNGAVGDYTATINWGDGSGTSSGTVTANTGGGFTVSGTHTYAEEGSDSVTVTIKDAGGSSATASSTATVADAALAATGKSLVSTNPVSGVVATFTDADPNGAVGDYTATINWGDSSTSSGTVAAVTGGFTVSGSHSYTGTGFFTITVTIKDTGGSSATATSTILIAGTSAGGTFVVGDGDAANGTPVTFWGAQWSDLNSLSGGSAPASFKGFADTPSILPACGATWTTSTGNSSNPPGTIPAYMAVLVASSVSQSGPTISGNDPHIVVVKTGAGYGSNPGHAGTGTVVGTLC